MLIFLSSVMIVIILTLFCTIILKITNTETPNHEYSTFALNYNFDILEKNPIISDKKNTEK